MAALALAHADPAQGQEPKRRGLAENSPTIERPASSQAENGQSGAKSATISIPPDSTPESRHPCGEDAYCYQAEDLRAQQQMAKETGSLVTIGWFGVFVSGFATYLLFLTLRESRVAAQHAANAAKAAQESLRLAERELSEGNRPRLVVSLGEIQLRPNEHFKLQVLIANAGERLGIVETAIGDFRHGPNIGIHAPTRSIVGTRSAEHLKDTPAPVPTGNEPVGLRFHSWEKMTVGEFEAARRTSYGIFFTVFLEYRDHLGEMREMGRTFSLMLNYDAAIPPHNFIVTGSNYDFDRKKESA